MRPSTRHYLTLTLLCAVMWLPGLPARTLWPNDEPRYALMARDMIETGEYVVPVNQGRIYHQKPPLFMWTEVLASQLLGDVTEASVRIPSFVAGTGCVLLAYWIGSCLFGPAAALLSALALATNARYMLSAQWAAPDMLLCLFITASLACFVMGYFGGRRSFYPGIYAMAAFGTLSKGPMGIILPFGTILLFLALRRDGKELRRLRLVPGVAITAAILAPWLLMFWHRAGNQEAADLLFKQTLLRYTHAWNNVQPWHFFFRQFPIDFLPWTLILIVAVAHAWSAMEKDRRLFLMCWFAAVFLFFTASSGKRGVYILPLYPAVALMVGWLVDQAGDTDASRRIAKWLKVSCVATGILFIAAGLILRPLSRAVSAPEEAGSILLAGSVLLGGAGLLVASLAPRRAFLAIAGAAVVLNLLAVTLAAPIENRRQNASGFGHEIGRQVPAGAPLGMVREHYEDLVFYSRRTPELEIRRGKRLRAWMEQHRTVYAVLDGRAFEDLSSHPDLPWKLLATDRVAGEEFYVVANR